MKNFDEIYSKLQLNHSIELNNLRNKCKAKIILSKYYSLFIFILFFILEGLNYSFIYDDYKFVFYLISCVFIVMFGYYFKRSFWYKKIKYPASEQIKIFNDDNVTNYIDYFKNNLIKDLILNLDENIVYSSLNGLNEDIYLKFFDKFDKKKYTKYISEDYIKFNDTWIYDVSTYRNETSDLKNEFKIFSGLVSIRQTSGNYNFNISSINNNGRKISKFYVSGNVDLSKEIIDVFNHFIDYTGCDFDLVCRDKYLLIRGHFNCMFDPNVYIGHMPKKLLYSYYKNLYEFIVLIKKITFYFE